MDWDRYLKAAHAMQTGVALEMSRHAAPTEPKHLRVGVNAAMSDQAGLVKLLIAKGIFTEDEYFAAIADKMEDEVADYEQRLSADGIKVVLR